MVKSGPIMKKLLILLTLTMLAGSVSCRRELGPAPLGKAAEEADARDQLAQALEAYKQRDDLQKVRMGIALLRNARTTDYNNYEAAWRLAQLDYYLGAHTDNEVERDTTFRDGIEVGKIAVKLQDGKPEGHFWLGANYGGSAEHSTLAGLSSVEDIRREMEAVLRIDEGYQSGCAYLGLGQMYLEAPRLLGGDKQKAVDYLEKGLRFGSNNAFLRLRLAEAYFALNRAAEARKQIDYLMKMTPDPDYQPEYKEAVEKGKQLLEKIDRS
jgi:tetratricopeptide (TPR) repeat protein